MNEDTITQRRVQQIQQGTLLNQAERRRVELEIAKRRRRSLFLVFSIRGKAAPMFHTPEERPEAAVGAERRSGN
jgi:hypothetical protein